MRTIALSLVAVLAGSAPVVAQHAHPPAPQQRPVAPPPPAPAAPCPSGMGGMTMMAAMDSTMAVMPRALPYAPSRLLGHRADLRLSVEQEARLVQLVRAAEAAADSTTAAAHEHRRQLADVLAAPTPDAAAADAHFEAAHAATGAGHRAQLRAALEARALLTDDQRGQVDAWGARSGMMR